MKQSCEVRLRISGGELRTISIPLDWKIFFINKLKNLGYEVMK